MIYDSITNRGEYFSNHYLAELLPDALKKQQWSQWTADAKDGKPTPRTRLRALRAPYQNARLEIRELQATGETALAAKRTSEWHAELLAGLGFGAEPQTLSVPRADIDHDVPVACLDGLLEGGLVAIEAGFATDLDDAFDPDGSGALHQPVATSGDEITTADKLATWLFTADTPPRYVLILAGGIVVLADRFAWGSGRYLAVDLDVALERNDVKNGGELDLIAGLFTAEMLRQPEGETASPLAALVEESSRHAVGVSKDLREALRRSVEIVANEVLARFRDAGVALDEIEVADDAKDLADQLRRESLRYLYRILFLLYAEARPDTGILPVDHPEYMEGYSLARLGELVVPDLDSASNDGFHFYESLNLLFTQVNSGYRYDQPVSKSESAGIRFEPMRSELFEPASIKLIGKSVYVEDHGGVDTRLRNRTLHVVLRLLMLTKGGAKRGRGRSAATASKQGGFISYAQLGINQLGAVYEGLMSYTGRIAEGEALLEVAKGGDPEGGSWLVPASKVADYPEDVYVRREDPWTGELKRVKYEVGQFVYRLAGRDRQTSASYYTPESLTKATVQLALDYRMEEASEPVTAAEMLRWKICEPALGSGAFLNEAINQVAARYLQKRQEELGTELPAEDYQRELQKVKAYIALHNSYGVDLNATAVELAEISLWLNVMHPGLQAPWFGLHLRQGNSLIGANRRYYDPKDVRSKAWLESAPVEHPFKEGDLPEGMIHHFLLPAKGWGAVAGEKEAKELAPEDSEKLNKWRKALRAKPKEKQVKRLQALSRRAEYLWGLVEKRLRISEQEIARKIDVWGAEDLPEPSNPASKEDILKSLGAVKNDLEGSGTPYWRLKTVMDAWCALWFWPVQEASLLDGSHGRYEESQEINLKSATGRQRRIVPLADLDDWIDFAEALLGRVDYDDQVLRGAFKSLPELSDFEDHLPLNMGMEHFSRIREQFPWVQKSIDIAKDQSFFHWELQFANIFKDGGFDLQVGNPPWMRPQWDESLVLAEIDPWFALAEKASVQARSANTKRVLSVSLAQNTVLVERAMLSGISTFVGDVSTYSTLRGTQPDLYRCFMVRTWLNGGQKGIVGLIHSESHFSGKREAVLRTAAYRRLRMHVHFVNSLNLFDIAHKFEFGLHIYGREREVSFGHATWIYHPDTAIRSKTLSDTNDTGDYGNFLPGLTFQGSWDTRPHPGRIIHVDEETLSTWNLVSDGAPDEWMQARLLFPVSVYESDVISLLAKVANRIGALDPKISSGLHETGASQAGIISWKSTAISEWNELILQGPHLGIGAALSKQPNIPCRSKADYSSWDLTRLDPNTVPNSNYVRACGEDVFERSKDRWVIGSENSPSRPYTDFYRVAWRVMINIKSERSLYAALIPRGPSHIDNVNSMALKDDLTTALTAGYWSSIPLDYMLRITGSSHFRIGNAKNYPAPDANHLLTPELLLRTLRLNCLTSVYSSLWGDLYESNWNSIAWAHEWPMRKELGQVNPNWEYSIPLRTEYERRAALVEIDALVAVMLGMTADQLEAIYLARYPVLSGREDQTWFDAHGRKICGDTKAGGFGQTKEDFIQLQAHLNDGAPPPAGYSPPFYKADRVAEMTAAHAEFTRRLEAKQREAGS
ncbi:class I SAM-dependent DNA methyltransferase [Glycomyces niveus]|uniref:site-specific DNA-methyltransferase (adenine-specific) n=1 Tax=Glycomyces niveus TaxID=2820287 RepID=A0ABS3U9L0_9ACTN|nr:class I SAM-dependent DNA methyltransferase [Glycomyces sp. NEAU-S30]MBO3735469.1 class I SAM-dependent DNA methyltransferase [Glycomyces sp. NEAU-S30]